jgi:peptidyl-prolyl cis-trans isomerase C
MSRRVALLARAAWVLTSVGLSCATSLLASCSTSSDTMSASQRATLRPGIVATVGKLEITAATVAEFAGRTSVAPKIALDRAITDALFASAAEREHIDDTPIVRAAIRARLARAALEQLDDEAHRGEPTDAEIAQATERHFVELDRPEAFRVIHALVQLPEKADAATTARARSLAERLLGEVARVKDERDFRARAEALTDRGGLEIVVETLKPVAADGRVVDVAHPSPDIDTYVLPFARAVARLTEPGQKSGIITSEFGFHVAMLLDRTPAMSVPFAERKERLRGEVTTARARQSKAALLERLAAATPVTIERSADTVLATVANHETR